MLVNIELGEGEREFIEFARKSVSCYTGCANKKDADGGRGLPEKVALLNLRAPSVGSVRGRG